MDSETDPQALAERVNELEETVAQLTGVSRRDVLFGAGAIGATAMAGGSLLSQSAAASESVGQLGAPDRRVDVFSDLVDANSVSTGEAVIDQDDSVRLNVPSDFNTVNDALVNAGQRLTPRALGTEEGAITIIIESGHQIQQSFGRFRNCILNYIEIKSQDDVVGVDTDNYPLNEKLFVLQEQALGPYVRLTIDCQNHAGGITVSTGSKMKIGSNDGVLNPVDNCLLLSWNASVDAHRCEFSGAGEEGILIRHGSNITVRNCEIKNNGTDGIQAFASRVCAEVTDITDNTNRGVNLRSGSWADVAGATVINNGDDDMAVERGSILAAHLAETTNGAGDVDSADTNIALSTLTDDGIIFTQTS